MSAILNKSRIEAIMQTSFDEAVDLYKKRSSATNYVRLQTEMLALQYVQQTRESELVAKLRELKVTEWTNFLAYEVVEALLKHVESGKMKAADLLPNLIMIKK